MIDGDLSALIGNIYSSAADDHVFAAVVEEVVTLTGSRTALVAAADVQRQSLSVTRWYGQLGTREARGIETTGHVGAPDPTFKHFTDHPGARHFDTALDRSPAVHDADPYVAWHREHFQGTHWMVAHSGHSDGSSFGIALHHGDRHASHDAGQRALFRMLFDHFTRAWDLAFRPPTLVDPAEAIVFLDARGCAVAMSAAAERLLARRDGILLVDRRPTAEARHQRRAFDALLASALSALDRGGCGGCIELERGSGAQPLIVAVDPLPAQAGIAHFAHGATLRLIDRVAVPTATARWRSLWNLTPAEARVAAMLVDTDFDLRAAADRLGTTYATVRSQLASILTKTDCRGQPQLMRLLTRVPG